MLDILIAIFVGCSVCLASEYLGGLLSRIPWVAKTFNCGDEKEKKQLSAATLNCSKEIKNGFSI